MECEDLGVRPRVEKAAPGAPHREPAKQVGSKRAQDHPWRQGYEQRMKLPRFLTSPPYWTLKEYPTHKNQLGSVADYDAFHDQLDKVWLLPGSGSWRSACVRGWRRVPLQAPARSTLRDADARRFNGSSPKNWL